MSIKYTGNNTLSYFLNKIKTHIDEIINKIPTKVSQLENDENFTTTDYVDVETDKFGGTVEITSGDPEKENTVLTIDPGADEFNVYTVEEVDEKVGQLQATKVDKTGVSLDLHTDGLFYIFVDGNPVGKGMELAGVGVAEQLIEFSQMNPIVTKYMEEVTYSPSDYSASSVLSYIYEETDYEKGHPVGCEVDIKEDGTLYLTDDISTVKKPSTVGANTLINMIPYEVSNWQNNVNGVAKQCGTIRPTGQVRMIKTTANNVRDLGGWSCDGGTIKYGKLFRGGLFVDTDYDVLVNQCKIKYDLDLRGKNYNDGITASPLGNEVNYVTTDEHLWYSIVDTTRKDEWKIVLSTIFNAVSRNEPVIFHCAAGADRTGTVACIVEAILGVSQSDIDKDFELTSFAIYPNARRRTDENWINLINEINSYSVGSTFRDKVLNWVGSLGFTVEEVNAFRKSMIDGNPQNVTFEEVVSHNVTYSLSNVTSSNTSNKVIDGQSYNSTISVNDGYEIKAVNITMGGNDITNDVYSNGAISIPNVTGNVVISISASKIVIPSVNYFNKSTASLNKRIGSSGTLSDRNGMVTTDYIEVAPTDGNKKFYVSGVNPVDGVSTYKYAIRTAFYDYDTKTLIPSTALEYSSTNYISGLYAWESDVTGEKAYIRISIQLKEDIALTEADVENLVITLE